MTLCRIPVTSLIELSFTTWVLQKVDGYIYYLIALITEKLIVLDLDIRYLAWNAWHMATLCSNTNFRKFLDILVALVRVRTLCKTVFVYRFSTLLVHTHSCYPSAGGDGKHLHDLDKWGEMGWDLSKLILYPQAPGIFWDALNLNWNVLLFFEQQG